MSSVEMKEESKGRLFAALEKRAEALAQDFK